MPEARVALLADERESGVDVELARRVQDVVGPQHHLAVADRTRVADALGDEALSEFIRRFIVEPLLARGRP